ncbi:uncharacterized protein [Argopecten irradians]|uniref:uncharacterized protein n=1 Tax=Argopecten irradians TaxID=31199 RepID=UPI00372206EA
MANFIDLTENNYEQYIDLTEEEEETLLTSDSESADFDLTPEEEDILLYSSDNDMNHEMTEDQDSSGHRVQFFLVLHDHLMEYEETLQSEIREIDASANYLISKKEQLLQMLHQLQCDLETFMEI